MTTLPTIHLNGTGARTLLKEYQAAYEALQLLQEKLANASCHARDYYPQGHEAYNEARYERAEMFAKLSDVEDYLISLIEHASNHVKH